MKLVKIRRLAFAAIIVTATTTDLNAALLSTSFTYQGQLKSQGVPLDGTVDLEVALFDLESGGVALDTVELSNIAVTNGLFSVELDFGAVSFNGDPRWLEIAVRSPHDPGDTEAYTTLTPRQSLTATPYALQTRGLFVSQSGRVGIGTDTPTSPFAVETTSAARAMFVKNAQISPFITDTYGIYAEADNDQSRAIAGFATSDFGNAAGIYGFSASPAGRGVDGFVGPTGGVNYGVHGRSNSTHGHGVLGYHGVNSGPGIGVKGKTESPDGYAGYFEGGKSYFGGNVGIGTETPNNDLTVIGSTDRAIYATTSGTYGVYGQSTKVGGCGVKGYANTTEGLNYGVYGETPSGGGYAGYFKGGRNYFQGYVGIGTDEPDYQLDVETSAGTAIFGETTSTSVAVVGVRGHASAINDVVRYGVRGTAGGWSGIGVFGEADQYGVRGRSLRPGGHGVSGYAWASGGIGVYGETVRDDGYAGYFEGGRNYFEGNVGIGVLEPTYPLEILTTNEFGIRTWMSNTNGVAISGHATGTSGFNCGGNFRSDSTDGRGVLGWATASSGTTYGVRGRTESDSGYAGYFIGGRNYFEGNVGIGTESPLAKLEVRVPAKEDALRVRTNDDLTKLLVNKNGTVVVGGFVADPGAELLVRSTADLDPLKVQVDGSTKFAVKRNGRTAIGANTLPTYQLQIYGEGTAGKPGGGSWTSSSDRRLKTNIHNLNGSLDRLMKLRSVSFEYKDPESINELPGTRLGMIAQEVEEVFPDWVAEGGHGFKTVTYRGFEALTVGALRELRSEKDVEIASLSERNADLEARVVQLEALVAKLADSKKGVK